MSKQRINITIDTALYEEIKQSAKDNFRSTSQEITYRLTTYKKPTHSVLSYPPGVRGIPETPYQVTATTTTATAGYATPIITPEEITPAPSNVYPATWLREHEIDPSDISRESYDLFNRAYPERSYEDFTKIQANRAAAYKPDPTDPYDPMTNNPYNRRKSVIG